MYTIYGTFLNKKKQLCNLHYNRELVKFQISFYKKLHEIDQSSFKNTFKTF